jgi:hypothetical protein
MKTKQKILVALLTAGCLTAGALGFAACSDSSSGDSSSSAPVVTVGSDGYIYVNGTKTDYKNESHTDSDLEAHDTGYFVAPAISVGENTVTIADEGSTYFTFTPAEAGNYAIYTTTADIYVDDGVGNITYLNTDSYAESAEQVFAYTFSAQAGQTILFSGSSTAYTETEATINIVKDPMPYVTNSDYVASKLVSSQTAELKTITFIAPEDGEYTLSTGMSDKDVYVITGSGYDEVECILIGTEGNPDSNDEDNYTYVFQLKAGEAITFTYGAYDINSEKYEYTLSIAKTGSYTVTYTLGADAVDCEMTSQGYVASLEVSAEDAGTDGATVKITIQNSRMNATTDYKIRIGGMGGTVVEVKNTETYVVLENALSAGTYEIYIVAGTSGADINSFSTDSNSTASFTLKFEKVEAVS